MEKYYYIGNAPTQHIEAFEAVVLGTLKEQRVLSNGQIVFETKEGIKGTPDILKDFSKYPSSEILDQIDLIEDGTN